MITPNILARAQCSQRLPALAPAAVRTTCLTGLHACGAVRCILPHSSAPKMNTIGIKTRLALHHHLQRSPRQCWTAWKPCAAHGWQLFVLSAWYPNDWHLCPARQICTSASCWVQRRTSVMTNSRKFMCLSKCNIRTVRACTHLFGHVQCILEF
jgi:hypothetical protein